jgi:hypothetical protein
MPKKGGVDFLLSSQQNDWLEAKLEAAAQARWVKVEAEGKKIL